MKQRKEKPRDQRLIGELKLKMITKRYLRLQNRKQLSALNRQLTWELDVSEPVGYSPSRRYDRVWCAREILWDEIERRQKAAA